MRRLLVLPVLVASVLAAASPGSAAPSEVVRRAGADRYATAVEVSKAEASPGVDVVHITTGASFADALAAAPPARPVLLVTGTQVPTVVADELRRLQPGRIVVLGGTAAVSDAIVDELESFTTGAVTRIAGADRYATAAAFSRAGHQPGVARAYVTSGESFADALAAGAAAVGQGPVLLTTAGSLPAAAAAELDRLNPGEIVIAGGTSAVSASVAAQLDTYTDGAVVRRAGVDRYATAVAVTQGRFASATSAYVASGSSFPDALAGAWAAGAAGAPVLLAQQSCVPDIVKAELDRLGVARMILLGGTAALGDGVARLDPCETTTTTTTATVIATGLEVPWDVAFVDGGRAYLTERKSGRVLLREPDGRITEVHRLPSSDVGEGGLLGLAASPTFAQDGLLYAFYTSSTDNRIVRFRPGGQVTDILTGLPRAAVHDAGRIAFGPDGMLYAATGDAGVPSRSQDPASLGGKILRMRPDGSVPADNPRVGSLVYASGFRDPQGLAWDAAGHLYATEFGPDRDDEVNLVVPNGNYGWPTVTGRAGDARFVDPIVVRQPAVASWSGAAVVRGGVPEWDGDLLVAALRGTRLYRFDLALDGSVVGSGEELYTGQYGRLRHVEQAPDGSLWVLTSNRDGRGTPVAADDRIIRIGR